MVLETKFLSRGKPGLMMDGRRLSFFSKRSLTEEAHVEYWPLQGGTSVGKTAAPGLAIPQHVASGKGATGGEGNAGEAGRTSKGKQGAAGGKGEAGREGDAREAGRTSEGRQRAAVRVAGGKGDARGDDDAGEAGHASKGE